MSTAIMTPEAPIHADDVEPQIWYQGTDREIRGRALCDVHGKARIGVGLLELPPGCNTRPAHFHTREEEHLYVLEGRATLHLGGDRFPLIHGSYVRFPAGQTAHHFIENDSSSVFRYLMIGERIAEDEVCYAESAEEREQSDRR